MAEYGRDWSGNSRSTLAMLGARNYAKNDREANDYYATEPKAARLIAEVEKFCPLIWECACGEGHLAREFEAMGYSVYATDLIDRGYGEVRDFLNATAPRGEFDIITNPPYSKATEFVEHSLELLADGHKAAMFLKIQFLESKARRKLFDKYPPKVIYVSSSRLRCAMNGDFERYAKSNAVCYAWFVWVKGYCGDTVIKWIN
jgi:hypothetical protein